MADTKISAATAVGTPAGTDEYATNQGGASKRTTLAQVKTFVTTDPDFAAGSASAGTWPNLASGTLLTTAEAGAIERDADAFYMTSDAGNRGAVQTHHTIIQDSNYTLTSTTSEQKLFNESANGALTIEAGTYLFTCVLHISSMSATSGNAAFDIDGAGTATIGDCMYNVCGTDNNSPTAVNARNGSLSNTAQTAASMIAAGTGTGMAAHINGMFRCTSGGTIIPSISLVTAAAAIVGTGSYFTCSRIGSSTVTTIGDWS